MDTEIEMYMKMYMDSKTKKNMKVVVQFKMKKKTKINININMEKNILTNTMIMEKDRYCSKIMTKLKACS